MTTIPARDKNIPMIAEAVKAPKRPERDVILEHDAMREIAVIKRKIFSGKILGTIETVIFRLYSKPSIKTPT